jgi:hypothetical protein
MPGSAFVPARFKLASPEVGVARWAVVRGATLARSDEVDPARIAGGSERKGTQRPQSAHRLVTGRHTVVN